MTQSALQKLNELERCFTQFGEGCAKRKLGLIRSLRRVSFSRADALVRFHDILCFLQAYPDSAELRELIDGMLDGFNRRKDLRRFRDELMNSGIRGTDTYYSFYAPAARWLSRNWGSQLSIDWDEFDQPEKLEPILDRLTLYAEGPALDEYDYEIPDWLNALKRDDETDASFLIRRLNEIDVDTFIWERVYDLLDIPVCLTAGTDSPCRSGVRFDDAPVSYQERPLNRSRPDLKNVMCKPCGSERRLSSKQKQQLIDLSRTMMVALNRELEVFSYADAHDVWIVDAESGLQFAFIGMMPERRLMFEGLYGYLVLKNGIPVGYGSVAALFNSAEIALNIFECYRAGETATIFAELLRAVRKHFGADTFSLDPYQIGQDNEEAIKSGAWWFYQKMDFRSRDKAVLRLMNQELKKMSGRSKYRSSPATLRKLATTDVFLHVGRERDDVLGLLALPEMSGKVSEYVSKRFGSERKKGERVCSNEAAALLGVRSTRSWTASEREAWRRWSPLVLVLPGVSRWSAAEKKALAQIIRSKGGARELAFVQQFDAHRKLRVALRKLVTV